MLPTSVGLLLLAAANGASAAVWGARQTPDAGGKTITAPKVIPSIWSIGALSAGTTPLTLTFVSPIAQAASLEAKMLDIAASNAIWLTDAQLKPYVEPSTASKAAVAAAIKALGGTNVKYNTFGDSVTFTTTVAQASKYFAATFNDYLLSPAGITPATIPRTKQYTIPAALAPYITTVSPISVFGQVTRLVQPVDKNEHAKRMAAVERVAVEERQVPDATKPAACNTANTTSICYRQLYGFTSYQPKARSAKPPAVGIMGYINQNFNPADLTTYLKKYRPEAAAYQIPVNTSDGAINVPLQPGLEAALDTQTVAAIIYPLPSTFYDVGTYLTQGDIFLLTFQNFLNMPTASRPAVISISYGSEEDGFTADQANAMCSAAQKLSAQGMTIVVSSGDSGVNGQGGASSGSTSMCPPFIPTYPSGCPYILSVGATENFAPETMVGPDIAGFYSGAGFSNIFPTPSYQKAAVAAYEKKITPGITPASDYNGAGRAFPDVSAQGSNQPIIVSGQEQLVGGTSCSAPIISGGLALLNDAYYQKKKTTIGWLNPTVYRNLSAWSDIVSGGSYDCGAVMGVGGTSDGLPAEPGWDSSAGAGTPVLQKLRAVFKV